METDTFFMSYKKYNSIDTFSIYILNVEKGVVKIGKL